MNIFSYTPTYLKIWIVSSKNYIWYYFLRGIVFFFIFGQSDLHLDWAGLGPDTRFRVNNYITTDQLLPGRAQNIPESFLFFINSSCVRTKLLNLVWNLLYYFACKPHKSKKKRVDFDRWKKEKKTFQNHLKQKCCTVDIR